MNLEKSNSNNQRKCILREVWKLAPPKPSDTPNVDTKIQVGLKEVNTRSKKKSVDTQNNRKKDAGNKRIQMRNIDSQKSVTNKRKEKVVNVTKTPVSNHRRVMVKNPLKHKQKGKPSEVNDNKTKIIEELVISPKTVKDRLKNAKIFEELNRDYEDDIFQQMGLKPAGFDLFLDNTDSDDSEISVHSARSPIQAYTKKRSTYTLTREKTPVSENNSPAVSPTAVVPSSYSSYAYIHKKIAESKKMERYCRSRKRFTSLLQPNIISETSKKKKLEASCRLLETAAAVSIKQDDQDLSETEDWFPEDDE